MVTEKKEKKQEQEEPVIQKEENNISDLENQLSDFKDKYLRLLAENENNRKIFQKQIQEAREYSITKFAKELLVVSDIFNKAFESIKIEEISDNSVKNFVTGIELTKKELEKILGKFGIKVISDDLVGQIFDPNFHEALITKEDNTKKNGSIFEVFEQGYVLGDRLLRAAKVGIIKN